MMRNDRKPPLPIRSPIRLRSRRILQPNSDPLQTQPGTEMKTKSSCKPSWDFEVSPPYTSMSCEFRALAKMVNEHNNNVNGGFVNAANNMFERGRFYDEYSARRNERLRRKKIVDEDKKTPPYKLGVRIAESAKTKRTKTISRSSVSASATATRRQEPPRYLLRSTTKTKPKPSLPLASTKSRTRMISPATIHNF